ncbi:MAG: leucine-rich repeat domain-containing protein [Bacillota bacterium]|nr:leucine-rich repeat domain-containing protein [Bacillota bacterium]
MRRILYLLLAILLALSIVGYAEEPREEDSAFADPVPGHIIPNLSESDFLPDQISDESAIVFDDPVLEARIRETIGKPEGDVTYGDARSFQGDLYASYNGQPNEEKIHSIEVLRYFTNLFKFEAFGQDIRDLEPIRGLKNLRILALDGNPVSDLSPIAELENLGILQISDIAETSDLSPVSGLPNLHTLYLRDNRIEDISALAGLLNLETLDLTNNNISDLSALSDLSKLTSLRLAGNPVTDFEPIREWMPNIIDRDFEPLFAEDAPDIPIEIAEPAFEAALRRAMNIYDRPITQRDAYLTRTLALHNEKTEESMFSDISPLKYFVNLEQLEFNSNPITDLSALSGLTKLKSLFIGFLQVSDLSPLAGLVNLDYLNIDFCPVEDLSPLSGLVDLGFLGAENCPVRDLTPLAGLAKLYNLGLKNCLVEDVSPLANLTNLKVLFLEGCPVADYSPLAGIYPNLEARDFEVPDEALESLPPAPGDDFPSAVHSEDSMFEDPMFEKRVRKMLQRPEGDIDPSELIDVTELIFNNWDYPYGEIPEPEKIRSLADLKYFPNLERLDIGCNAVSDLSPISALKKLYYLEAPKNNISDLSPLTDMIQLTWAVFWENNISDLAPVSNLVNLETFSVFSNNVMDISPLANLTKLTILELHDNPFTDYSPVAEIYPNLREKDFSLGEPERRENTSGPVHVTEGWHYDESTRTLTIDSDAAMVAYQPDQENAEAATQTNAPWAANLAQIEHIIVGDNVTLLSDYAFAYASALKQITIGKSVSTMGFRCLYRCGGWNAGEDLEIIVNCDVMPALGEDVMGYTWDNPHTFLTVPVSQAEQWKAELVGSRLRIVVQ